MPVSSTTRDRQIARLAGAGGEENRVVLGLEPRDWHIAADIHSSPEHDPFLGHDGKAAVEHPLLHLELGDSVSQQAANTVGPLEHGDQVPCAVQLVRRGEPCGARAHHSHLLPGSRSRLTRRFTQPSSNARSMIATSTALIVTGSSLIPSTHDPSQGAGTQPPGELGEVIGRVQPVDRGLPAVAIDQIVPVGNQVPERAALMAERHAAVHAARGLLLQFGLLVREIDFPPVVHALLDGARRVLLAVNLDEACGLAHVVYA